VTFGRFAGPADCFANQSFSRTRNVKGPVPGGVYSLPLPNQPQAAARWSIPTLSNSFRASNSCPSTTSVGRVRPVR